MRLKTLVCILGLCCQHLMANAHHRHPQKRAPRKREDYAVNNLLKLRVTPSGIIHRFGSGIPIGVEYTLSHIAGVTLDVSIPLRMRVRFDETGPDRKDIQADLRIGTQIRRYFGRRRASQGMYGLEFFYNRQKFSETYGAYHTQNEYFSYSYADVTKQVYGLAVFFGGNFHLGGRTSVELRSGIGVKWAQAQRDHVAGLKQGERLQGFFPTNEDQVRQSTAFGYFPASITITHGIGKRK